MRFTGIVRGMLTVSGIQIVSIAATRNNSSLHHAHATSASANLLNQERMFSVVQPRKARVSCHLQADDPVEVSYWGLPGHERRGSPCASRWAQSPSTWTLRFEFDAALRLRVPSMEEAGS